MPDEALNIGAGPEPVTSTSGRLADYCAGGLSSRATSMLLSFWTRRRGLSSTGWNP